ILRGVIPSAAVAIGLPADSQTLTLADGVEHKSHVAADFLAVERPHLAGVGRQVTVQEFAERSLTDEADAGGILLVVVGQTGFARDLAHLALVKIAKRKHRSRDLGLIQAVQEIALVLGAVLCLEQLIDSIDLAYLRVVSGRDALSTHRQRVIEKRTEFDFGIAQHVRVWRAARYSRRNSLNTRSL